MIRCYSATVVLFLCLAGNSKAQQLRHIEIDPAPIAAARRASNWCWAAGAEMMLRAQGVNIPQERLVERVYGPNLPNLPTFGRFEPIQQAVSGVWRTEDGDSVRVAAAFNYGVPTNPAGMVRSIQANRPFLFAYAGHAYVAYGITWHEQPTFRVVELNLIDPMYGFGKQKYTTFNVFRDDVRLINGTFELVVER